MKMPVQDSHKSSDYFINYDLDTLYRLQFFIASIILPNDHYGTHLDTQEKTIKK